MPYEIRQAIEYITKLAKKNNILLTNLENSLRELEGQIPFYPLSLRLLIEVVEKHNEVPASITELYNKYVGIAVGEFEVSIEIDKLFDPSIKKDFFAKLAYEMYFLNNKVKISYKDYELFCTKFFENHTFITDKASFLENILRVGLLNIEKDEVQFSHKTFLDFFIALFFHLNKEELQDEGKFDVLFELYSIVDQWEDVAFFYFGLKKKISKIDLDKLESKILSLDNEFEIRFNLFYLGRLVQYAWMTDDLHKKKVIKDAMDISLGLKDMFHSMFKTSLDMTEVPKLISSISMLHLIDFCYSSAFLRNETKQLIAEGSPKSDDAIYFSTIYLLKNASLLGKDFVNDNLKNLVPKIQKMPDLENRVLLTMLIDFFEKKKKIELDEELDKSISKIMKKYKKAYPDVFRRVLSIKKKDFKILRSELTKKK